MLIVGVGSIYAGRGQPIASIYVHSYMDVQLYCRKGPPHLPPASECGTAKDQSRSSINNILGRGYFISQCW